MPKRNPHRRKFKKSYIYKGVKSDTHWTAKRKRQFDIGFNLGKERREKFETPYLRKLKKAKKGLLDWAMKQSRKR